MTKKKRFRFKIPTPALFVITAILVLYFLPRDVKYSYAYTENKPWQYGLLTAPFNFNVYKAEGKVQAEKDSIMKAYQPYYIMDFEVGRSSVSVFEKDAKAQSVNEKEIRYISKKLGEIYKAGVISVEDYDKVESLKKKQLLIDDNDDHLYIARNVSSFFTARMAYDKLKKDSKNILEPNLLDDLNINDYLTVNILYDEETSRKVKSEMLKQVSLYEGGKIQQGEKIIDRGEIITPHIKEVLDSYTRILDENGGQSNPGWLLLGESIIVILIFVALFFYMRYYRLREYSMQKKVTFILILVAVFPIIVGNMVGLKLINWVYIIPFAVPTILVRTFIDSRTAMTTHALSVLICALMLPISMSTQFIIIQILIGYTTILSLRHLSERSQLVFCSLIILVTYMVTYTGWLLATEGDYKAIISNKWIYVYFCINFILVSFAYLLVYVCEKIFGFISEVSMIELSNTNRPLLQRLSEVAPGTFQHSMQVSNLVVAAAQKIGANAALLRVGALYHDIGKMSNAAFFTENQSPGMDPHAGLTEKESAKIIIDHVDEGVRIAKKHKLPQQVIDFIETHHGKSKVKYFFNTYSNKHPEEDVDEAEFTYHGRNPFTRETALLMMADTIEAASRSLTEYTPETIRALVDKLIDIQVSEGMFKYAPITFRDIEDAKDVFTEKLTTIYHSRISYPELKNKDSKEEDINK